MLFFRPFSNANTLFGFRSRTPLLYLSILMCFSVYVYHQLNRNCYVRVSLRPKRSQYAKEWVWQYVSVCERVCLFVCLSICVFFSCVRFQWQQIVCVCVMHAVRDTTQSFVHTIVCKLYNRWCLCKLRTTFLQYHHIQSILVSHKSNGDKFSPVVW